MDRVVTTGGGALRYRVEGPADGEAVLCLHALGTGLELWDPQMPALADRFRVIRYDMRGHGQSTATRGDYRLDDLGADAVAVLDDAGVNTAHVVGISIGALTALWLGIHQPHRVGRLLVAHTAARVGTAERWNQRMALVRESGMAAVAEVATPGWFTPEFREHSPDVVDRFAQMVASTDPVAYLGCCMALREADLRGDLQRIHAPALIVAGNRDQTASVADAQLIADAVPGAALLVLESAHLGSVECADTFTRHALAFLEGRGPAPEGTAPVSG